MGVATAAQLRGFAREELVRRVGDRLGPFLYLICRGQARWAALVLRVLLRVLWGLCLHALGDHAHLGNR